MNNENNSIKTLKLLGQLAELVEIWQEPDLGGIYTEKGFKAKVREVCLELIPASNWNLQAIQAFGGAFVFFETNPEEYVNKSFEDLLKIIRCENDREWLLAVYGLAQKLGTSLLESEGL